jgi:Uma2 family endonuclease
LSYGKIMTVTPPPAKLLTYEDYVAEEVIKRRYDILDGVRTFLVTPTRRHQDILANTAIEFRVYQRSAQRGRIYHAPCDILITRVPLRTRQPDVLFMSNARLAQNPPPDDPAPLDPAPELVVEILSPSDTRSVLTDKLRDYGRVNVLECWVLSPMLRTVEVLLWDGQAWQSVATYGAGESVVSVTFPDLMVSVDAIFSE